MSATPARSMELVTDPHAYFLQSSARILRGRRFACARTSAGYFGFVAWGHVEERDARELIDVFDAAVVGAPKGREQLVDLRAVSSVSPHAMASFMRYYATRPDYVATVAREAVVRPDGPVGVLAEGLYRVVPLPFEGKVFRHVDEAFAWLGEPLGWPEAALPWLTAALRDDPHLPALQALVRAHGVGIDVDRAARATRQSARSLQRYLRGIGTTWPRLRASLVVEVAKERLRGREIDLKQLAYELGFQSASHFTRVFRAVAGMPPSAWRDRALRGDCL